MTKELLVMARFKGGDPASPRFTQSTTVDKLMEAIASKLPVDMIYYMLPDADGGGYSLRVAGLVTLDIIPPEHLIDSGAGHQSPAPQPAAPAASEPEIAVFDQGEEIVAKPIPEHGEEEDRPVVANSEPARPARQERAAPQMAHSIFERRPIKSQKQLLEEKGLAIVVDRSIGKDGRPVLTERIVPKSKLPKAKKGAKGRSAKARVTEVEDDKLPNPVSRNQRMVVDSIQTATPEEAIAASHFGASD